MKVHKKHNWPVILITLCLVSFLVISSTVGFVANDTPNRVERITPNPENNDQTQVFDIEIDQGSIYDGKPQAGEPQRVQTSYASRSGTRKADTCWSMLRNTADRIGVSSSAIPGSGAVLWSNKTALSYASPVTANNRVFMATNAGYIACYEETTGNLCWQTQLSIKTENSAVSTPAVSSGFIIAFCSGDGTLYKLNIYTGEINWTYKLPGKGTTINAAHIDYPILIYQGQVLFGAPNKYFYCLNETTGKLVWRFKTLQGLSYDYGITSGAAAFGSSIYFGANDGYLYAMDLDGFLDSVNDGPWLLEGVNISNTDGDVLWKFFTGDSICSTPTVINNYVYVTVGIHDSSFSNYNIFKIFCINRNNGLLVWEYQTENHLVSSPAIEGDKVIFGSLDGKIYCLTTTSNTSQWTPFTTTGEVWSSPAVSGLGGKLVVGATDGKLYCIYTHNGVSDWQRILDGAITSSPALGNNRIFVNTRKGTLYCLGAADTELPKIINTTPMVDEINVPVSNYITIKFDEPIKTSSISINNFKLSNITTEEIPIGLEYDEETWAVTVKSRVNLNTSNLYTVTVKPGVTDWAGNKLEDEYKWSFTTNDNNPPELSIAEVSPITSSLGTNFEFTVLYTDKDDDPPLDGVGKDILIYFDDGTNGQMVRNNIDFRIRLDWRDDDYTDGEQFIYNKKFKTQGIHSFRIWCSDGVDWNETIVLNQPVIPGPPKLKTIPDQYIEEDEDLVLNLTEYLSDPDTPLDNLIVNVNSSYSLVNGLEVSFNYPNSFNYPSGREFELVNVSVSDLEFSTQKAFRIWVSPVNDPPTIEPIPTQIVIENEEDNLTLSEYIFDVDNTLDELNITEDSENARINKSVNKLFLNYPVGGQTHRILLNVSDGEFWVDRSFDVKVVSSEVSFVMREINDIEVIEDIEYLLDLTDEIIIIKGASKNLSVKCNSEYSIIDGLEIKFLYTDSFTYTANKKFEEVKITVTDEVVNYSQSTNLRVNVTSINDAPILNNGTVDPDYGNITIEFTFTVYYYDTDSSKNMKIQLVLDGKKHTLGKGAGDKSSYPGIQYSLKMTMGIGYHYYYFFCDDGSGAPNSKCSTNIAKFYVTGNLGAQIIPEPDFNKTGNETDDQDRDGIPDTWEKLNGLDYTKHSDALEDFDDDDFINLLEYLGHDGLPSGNDSTDPNDPLDKPITPPDTSDKSGITVYSLLLYLVLIIIILIIIIFIYNMITGRGLMKAVKLSEKSKSPKTEATEDEPDSDELEDETERVPIPDDDDIDDMEPEEVVEVDTDEDLESTGIDEDEDIDEYDLEEELPKDEVPVTVVDLTMDDQPFFESDLKTEEEGPDEAADEVADEVPVKKKSKSKTPGQEQQEKPLKSGRHKEKRPIKRKKK